MDHPSDVTESVPFKIQSVEPGTTEEDLLGRKGWFYLNEVFIVLDAGKTGKYKLAFKQIQRLCDRGEDPYEVMGRKKFGGRVGVLMERFAPWYRANLILRVCKLDGRTSFQDFLMQKPCYYRLSEVCKFYQGHLPYTYSMLKRTADKCTDPLNEMGILKYDTTYLVALPGFEKWLREQILS